MATIDEQLASQADYLEELAAAIRRIEGRNDAQARAALEALLGEGTPARLGGSGNLTGGTGLAVGAIGTTVVGDTMGAGGLTWPTVGYNLLYDPTFEGQNETAVFPATDTVVSYGAESVGFGESHDIVEAWYATLVAGGSVQTGNFARRGQTVIPFNSSDLSFYSFGTGATVRLRSVDIVPDFGWATDVLVQPYLTAAIVAWNHQNTTPTVSSSTLTLEIYDATDAAVRASMAFDLTALDAGGIYRLTCSFRPTAAQKLHAFQLRATWAAAHVGGYSLHLGDPILAWAFTPDVPPYSPALGRWLPELVMGVGSYPNNRLASGRMFGEDRDRFGLGVAGWLEWFNGASAAAEGRLRRTGTKELTWDDGAPGGAYDSDAGPVRTKHLGPLFVQGPNAMDLAVTYDSPGKPNGVTRADEGAGVSSTVITYAGPQVASVVTTRFGKTLTVTPTYTGADITSIHRAVT